MISLIAAMDRNRLIGADGRIPWHLPDDMRWFREQTMGKPVIMGRKTYESIPDRFRPLPGRLNIILTHNWFYQTDGATVVHSIKDALAAAGEAEELMVIGGVAVYGQLLPQASRLYLTLIDAEFEGDAYFPEINPANWTEQYREIHHTDERHPFPFSWVVLERL
jgi:dihydrofolate reductase